MGYRPGDIVPISPSGIWLDIWPRPPRRNNRPGLRTFASLLNCARQLPNRLSAISCKLAILTLIEPPTRPLIVMKPPETLQFRALLPADPRLCPSPRQYGLRRIGSRRRSTEQACVRRTLTLNSQIRPCSGVSISLLGPILFPVPQPGNFGPNALKAQAAVAARSSRTDPAAKIGLIAGKGPGRPNSQP
jgi:hypothetical protein